VVIDYLANHTEAIPVLAAWFHEEWSYLYPERTLYDVERSIAGRSQVDRIPIALVAMEAGEVIGTVCLKVHDMDTHLHLSPWLAGLYVARTWRGRGIGSALVRAMEEKAQELEVGHLYLYTPDSESFYASLDWRLLERVPYHGSTVAVMEKQIARGHLGTVYL